MALPENQYLNQQGLLEFRDLPGFELITTTHPQKIELHQFQRPLYQNQPTF